MNSRRSFLKRSAGLTALALAMKTQVSAQENNAPAALISRKDVAPGDTWDLSSIFSSDDAWKTALEAAQKRLDEFKPLEGTLNTVEALLHCFKLEDSIDLDLERILIYAYLRYSEDVADPVAQNMQSLADALQGQAREATSFIRPELLALEESAWNAIAADKAMSLYVLKMKRIFRQKPHVLPKGEEQILAMLTDVTQTASKAFNLLNDADLKFGMLPDETGNAKELSTGSFVVFLNSPDRKVREAAFNQFYTVYESHQNTLASLLGSSVQKNVFNARVRKFPSALDAALFYSEVPQGVYNNLIQSINKALPTLHRYYELRRRKMGIPDIRMYDTYIPILSGIKTNYAWDEAVAVVGKALQPLGDEYVHVMTEGLTAKRWCDRYENKGKRSGAFSYGNFSANPYILMNYKPTVINSVFTLAHEAGHSMHSFHSARSQPFVYYDYVTFLAEVASTFNEDMLSRYLLSQTDDKNMKAYLINRQIDSIRSTIFRQTMFAEFEQRTHSAAEAGESLTATTIRGMYRKLLDTYFGPKFAIDDLLETECFRVPHFYRAFYVYQYATGMSAALSLAERVSSGGEKERKDYLAFLSGGSSASPIELLKIAGVDMESPKPINDAMQRFDQLVAELDALI